MIALRIVGGVFAVTLLVGAARQYQRRNVSRLSLIITWLVGGLIVVLAVAPVVFNPVFDVFKFKKGTGGRLIGVLLFANVVAFFLLFRNMSTIDSAARSVRLLIEALSLQAFDRKQAEDLPAGQRDVVNGSRVLGEFERESLIRHVGVHFFSWLVTVLTGSRVTDVSNGYRAIRADILKGLVLDQDQFWTGELLIEVMRQRRRILEVPITIRARTSGVSKKPKTFKYARNFTKA